jgi:hypothetical protein
MSGGHGLLIARLGIRLAATKDESSLRSHSFQ